MKKENGFTLVELLIVMVIGAIVMAAGYASFISQQHAYRMTESVSDIQQNLRAAMLFIEKDLRMAGFNPLKKPGFGFGTKAPDSFSIIKDSVDEDGDPNDPGEQVTYTVDSNNLKRQINDGNEARVIAKNITYMSLIYYDVDGNETADASSIRSVSVTLRASDDEHIRELTSVIKCRNMGL